MFDITVRINTITNTKAFQSIEFQLIGTNWKMAFLARTGIPNPLPMLPLEVSEYIFPFLTHSELTHASLVSHSWHSFCDSQFFWNGFFHSCILPPFSSLTLPGSSLPSPLPRLCHSAVTTHNGKLLWIHGGDCGDPHVGFIHSVQRDIWLFDVVHLKWVKRFEDPTFLETTEHSAVVCHYYHNEINERSGSGSNTKGEKELMIVFGGNSGRMINGSSFNNTVRIVDLSQGLNSTNLTMTIIPIHQCQQAEGHQIQPEQPCARSAHSAVMKREEEMIVFGGWNSVETFNDLWSLNIKTWEWKEIKEQYGDIPTPRRTHKAVEKDGMMWVF